MSETRPATAHALHQSLSRQLQQQGCQCADGHIALLCGQSFFYDKTSLWPHGELCLTDIYMYRLDQRAGDQSTEPNRTLPQDYYGLVK